MTIITEHLAVTGPGLANFSFPDDQAVFMVGDVHGESAALRRLLERFGRLPTPGLSRTLVFLGDLIDRGPDSLGALRTALEDARDLAQVDHVVMLPGNHELMLACAIEDALEGQHLVTAHGSPAMDWYRNGGMAFMIEAYEAIGRDMPSGYHAPLLEFRDMLPHTGHDSFLSMVRSWPSHFALGDLLCVHAGLIPRRPHELTLCLGQREHYTRMPYNAINWRHWAWVRDDCLEWQGGWARSGALGEDGVLLVHGHTSPSGLRGSRIEHSEDVRAFHDRMATNARVNLDGGSARGHGVTGAMLTAAGLRLAYEHT